MKKILLTTFAILMLVSTILRADEGMWLPMLVQKLNISKMKELGCQLTAAQIYDINNASLKDAVVALDHGMCTAELISKDGLLLTNHHCGYEEIQAHSSVAHDYLTNGFVAHNRAEELSNPGKTASFLINITDITGEVLSVVKDGMSEEERSMTIYRRMQELEKTAKLDKPWYEARVMPMFRGTQFFLFIYETYKDIRLVFAPPESIGKFGGDTDNWEWPRHTGDFSVFRIYCAPMVRRQIIRPTMFR